MSATATQLSTPEEDAAIAEWSELDAVEKKARDEMHAAIREWARALPGSDDEALAEEEMRDVAMAWHEAEADLEAARAHAGRAARK